MFNPMTSGYSLSDIAAVTDSNNRGNNSGWGNGDGAWWIIILFLFVFCGWGGNGFGGYGNGGAQGALTRGELCQDMNFSDLEAGVRGLQSGLCDGFYTLNTGMLNGFSGVQNTLASEFRGVDNAICTLGYNTQAGFNSMNLANAQNTNTLQNAINDVNVGNMMNTNSLQRQIADCCCENRAAVADIKYTMATDACAINTAIANSTRDMIDNQNANTRSILDFLVNDKISTLESQNAELRLSASQAAQNNYLVNALRPCPIPAYQVANPFCCNNNNFNCGCGY